MINVGFDNFVPPEQVAVVVGPRPKPVSRMVKRAGQADRLIDVTSGRRTKGVVILDSGQVILSSLTTVTLAGRFDREVERRGLTGGEGGGCWRQRLADVLASQPVSPAESEG